MHGSDSNYIKNSLAFLNQFLAESQFDSGVNASGPLMGRTSIWTRFGKALMLGSFIDPSVF